MDSAAADLKQSALFRNIPEADLLGLDPPLEVVFASAGTVLMRQGETDTDYYHLVSGRLRVFTTVKNQLIPVAHVNPGEGVGEMALLTGNPRSSTVIARLDSRLVRVRQATLLKLLEKHPSSAIEISRIVIQRLGQKPRPDTYGRIAIIPLHRSVDSGAISGSLATALGKFGTTCLLDAKTGAPESESEPIAHYEIYDAGQGQSDWSRYCLLHADLILVAVDAGCSDAPDNALLANLAGFNRSVLGRMDLLIAHPDQWNHKFATATWLAVIAPQEHHHLRTAVVSDMQRLARNIAGRSVNLVLGGGGARAFAQFGVLQAFLEAGVPIDRVGGSSMGALVGAVFAYGEDFGKLVAAARESFRRRKPAAEFTLPLLSALSGKRLQQVCIDVCGDWQIENLPLNFFCVSVDLGNADIVTHVNGPVWLALRSSGAMPVIGPPLLSAGRILIDGGVRDNLPVGLMRSRFAGTTIAVDVSSEVPLRMDAKWELSCPSGFEILWNKIKPFAARAAVPSIFEVLYRTLTLNTTARLRESRDQADWLICPPVEGYGITDFNSFETLVDLGYRHAVKLLEEMKQNPELAESRGLKGLL